MSKLISISVDVTKLHKDRFYKGRNGALYANLDIWINDEPDKYGNDASVSEAQSKDERDTKAPRNYVGSGKKLAGWGQSSPRGSNGSPKPAPAPRPSPPQHEDIDDSVVPF